MSKRPQLTLYEQAHAARVAARPREWDDLPRHIFKVFDNARTCKNASSNFRLRIKDSFRQNGFDRDEEHEG